MPIDKSPEIQTSTLDVSLVWLGAGISLAEILAGTEFASLGFEQGVLAILLGHLIGGILFLLAGLVSARTGKTAMMAAQNSFGQKGASLFALLNIVQLLGWIAVLNFDGALAANGIWGIGVPAWCVIIGLLIAAWVAVGLNRVKWISRVAIVALLLLTFAICATFIGGAYSLGSEAAPLLSFGAAVELAVAMPLSWLPMIGDYTAKAEKPIRASITSAIAYSAVSIWMYLIGMIMMLVSGNTDIARAVIATGLGAIGLLVCVFSTVTTNFVAAFSSGVSFATMAKPFGITLSPKAAGTAIAILAIPASIVLPLGDITEFLYLIGSVFAPMAAILIADNFILKTDNSSSAFNARNLAIWLAGFFVYRVFLGIETPVGSTLPSMLIVIAISVACNAIVRKFAHGR